MKPNVHRIRCGIAVAVTAIAVAARAADDFPKPSADERRAYIRRARVCEDADVAAKDVFAGPKGRLAISPGDEVTCDFVPEAMSGMTEKFRCRLEDGTAVKVKYVGPSHYKEVFGEVLGTRLFWSLGFYADRMIPAKVTCRGCPQRPWEYVDAKRAKADGDGKLDELPHEAMVGTYRFDPAAIEEPFDGETIEEKDQQGWDWDELDLVDPSAGGSTRAEVDALRLLNAFVQNSDNKAKQNTLACPRDAIVTGEGGKVRCERPILVVDDLASVFGGGGITTGGSGRIDFEGWKSRKVWKDEKECRARLTAIGGMLRSSTLKDPVVGEGGRELLANRLARLSDEQIADLFRVAGVEKLELTMREGTRAKRAVTIEDWVALFKEKRREIVEHPGCPTP